MYRTIHVPLDDSAPSRRAAEVAVALAATLDASLVGVHVDPRTLASERRRKQLATLPPELRPAAESRDSEAAEPAPCAAAQWLQERAEAMKIPCESVVLSGRPATALRAHLEETQPELVVLGAVGAGDASGLGSTCQELARTTTVDLLVVKEQEEGGAILCCIDGSPQSYAGLQVAMDLGPKLGQSLEAVAVYDPYLHYTLFNGIVNVLSEQASKVFKFKDQEKLHEEIIDTGLAKIYQAHLEVARSVAAEKGVELPITLLDGKASQKVLRHAVKTPPSLAVIGRIGVHSDDTMDIGATAESLLRQLPCSVLMTSRKFVPPIDVRAHESVQWVPEATAKIERAPAFVRGVARTAVVRWAIERGHSVITPSVINSAMGELLPPGAAQAMGYIAEEVAKSSEELEYEGKTYLCPTCGYAARDYRPTKCSVCKTEGTEFEAIDRQAIESLGSLEKGDLEEEATFDGRKLTWTAEAKAVLRRVPNGYERRRAKARIEKTAKVRGLTTVTEEFAIDMVEQEVAEASYLSASGERLEVEKGAETGPDDTTPRPREESPLAWTDAAWKRICRVPEGFMRDMTRQKVEEFAAARELETADLALCEDGIAEGRRMMAEMLTQQGSGPKTPEATPTGSSS